MIGDDVTFRVDGVPIPQRETFEQVFDRMETPPNRMRQHPPGANPESSMS